MYKLLMSNNFENLGRKLAGYLVHFGFKVVICSNIYADLFAELDKNSYDGLFFYAFELSEKTYSFIKTCILKFPHTKIFVASNYQNINRIINVIGRDSVKCIVYPYSVFDVCYDITECYYSHDEMIISPKTAEFLSERNFPASCRGFYYYCCLIECAVKAPDSVDSLTRKLYTSVADKMDTTYSNVERGIRVMLSTAYKRGIIINGNIIREPIKNKLLIRSLANDYKDIFLSMNNKEPDSLAEWL